jgi:hypothetical protein
MTSPVALLRVALVVFLSLPNVVALALSDQTPPTAFIVREDFVPLTQEWQPASGAWSINAGTYNSTAAGTTDITRIVRYRGIDPSGPGTPALTFDQFSFGARVRSKGAGMVGIVYHYQDPANYDEALLSTDGVLFVRRVSSGATFELAASALSIRPNVWYDIAVQRDGSGVITLSVDGQPVVIGLRGLSFNPGGQVGLVAHNVAGQFDKVVVTTPFGDQPFKHDFSSDAPGWTPQSGQWNVLNGTYNDAAVQQTNVTLAPISTGVTSGPDKTGSYTVHARMLNPYANSGNLVGLVFDYGGASYTEVVFSPLGVAKMNLVTNGRVQTLATAAYNGRRNVWFDVQLDSTASVWVDGERIFDQVPGAHPNGLPEGGVGLITHWAPGKFDDVWFDHDFFRNPCSETFASGPVPEVASGTWGVSAGTLNASSVNVSSIALPCRVSGNFLGDDAGTDFVYGARLFNPYGASGNLVGLVFNYQERFASLYAGDYYELVFSPTGSAFLNKFIQGVSYRIATFPHNVPRNTWFDVQLFRSGIFTTFMVNGVTIARDVPQGELHGGRIGVITHWSPGRFDDLSLQPYVVRSAPVSYRLTHIETPPDDFAAEHFTLADLNDDAEIAGKRIANDVLQAFIWRAGTFQNLNPLLPSDVFTAGASAVNNQHDVIVNYQDQQFASHPFFLSGAGQSIPLTNLPNGSIQLIDLNDRREILISARTEAVTKFFIWRSGQLTPLPEMTSPGALNNLGVVLGGAGNPSPALWQGGTVMLLPLPEGAFLAPAGGLNDHDEVAGTGFFAGRGIARTGACVWREAEATILIPPDPVLDTSSATRINNRGVVVGSSYNSEGFADETATIWDGTRGQDLNTLISRQDPLQPFVHLRGAELINNPGQIVARGIDKRRTDGRESWYLLTPVATQ